MRRMHGPSRIPQEYVAVVEVHGFQVGAAASEQGARPTVVSILFDLPNDERRKGTIVLSTPEDVANVIAALRGCAAEIWPGAQL